MLPSYKSIQLSQIQKHLTPGNILIVMIVYGTLFQIGFNVAAGGPNFASMATAQDWFNSIIYVITVFLVLFNIFLVLLGIAALLNRKGLLRKYDWIIIPATGIAAVILTALPLAINRPDLGLAAMAILGTASGLCQIATFLEKTKCISPFHLAFSGFCLLALFGVFGGYEASRSRLCTVIASDGRFDKAYYLRAIGDGHLFHMGNETVFIQKDKIAEIRCPTLREQ